MRGSRVENQIEVYPQWTAKMGYKTRGRDHLGLGSVSSDQILPRLAPSINVLTFHPRYHSFYIFLLDEFWRKDLPRNMASWAKFYRPREFIFSVGCYLCNQPEHGEMGNIVGGQKTGPLAAEEKETYNTSTNYIKSTLGGFGLYYRTVMAELGLLHPGGRGFPYPVDVPTEPLGKNIAAAFREAVQGTSYYRNYFQFDQTEVPRQVIQEYIHKACLCQLKTSEAHDRGYLRDVFEKGGPGKSAQYRKLTMRMFLDIAKQTQEEGLNEDSFRQLIYFGEAQTGQRFVPSMNLISISKMWRLYQVREYYSFALNMLWDHFCIWGLENNGDHIPLKVSLFWDYLESRIDFDYLIKSISIDFKGLTSGTSFSKLLEGLMLITGSEEQSFDQNCNFNCRINEDKLYQIGRSNRRDGKFVISGMLTMLAIIYLRFCDNNLWQESEWEISKMGSDGRLSLDGFIRQTKRMVTDGLTIFEILKRIYENYIIQQHIIVATRKLPDNSFRFRREGNRLRFFHHNNSIRFMSARFDSISTTVFELGYCDDLHLPNHSLSEYGEKLLKGEV